MGKELKFQRVMTNIVTILLAITATVILVNRLKQGNLSIKQLYEISTDYIGLIIITCFIYACMGLNVTENINKNLVFSNLLVIVNSMILFDMFAYAVEGMVGEKLENANYIFTSLEYLFNGLTIFGFVLYFESHSWVRYKATKIYRNIVVGYLVFLGVTLVLNLKYHFGFSIVNGIFQRGPLIWVYNILTEIFLVFTLLLIDYKKIEKGELISVLVYIFLPVSVLIIRVFYSEVDFTFTSIILSTCIIYVQLHLRQERIFLSSQKTMEEEKTKLMLSQIKPHFIYNTLNSIASLCSIDPEKAREVTIGFSDYLRGNMDAVNGVTLIPISNEIEHTKHYTDIEQVRFGKRINIEYNIDNVSFLIPSLTIQPIVENAIKHGICNKKNGGKVKITIMQDNNSYLIIIEDNGIGFDMEEINDDGKNHYGMHIVSERISNLVNGTMEIDSKKEIGTVVKITIPKV